MAPGRPPRVMDPCSAEFWHYTETKELRVQKCSDCQKRRWPPSPFCDACLSEDYTWPVVTGLAKLLSWVVFHKQYFPEYPPGNVVIAAELDEGPIFISTIDHSYLDMLRDGLSLKVGWVEGEDRLGQYHLPIFLPA
jgi:uncharacterized OB-fold protein